jgi:hypothetical protein
VLSADFGNELMEDFDVCAVAQELACGEEFRPVIEPVLVDAVPHVPTIAIEETL